MIRRLVALGLFSACLIWPGFVFAQSQNGEARIFDLTGKLKTSFAILDGAPAGTGVNWAVGDVVGDSKKEFLVCTPFGEETKVVVYDNEGKKLADFVPYENFRGGCYLSTGQLDDDAKDEILVSAGYTGGPHIKVFDYNLQKFGFFAFNKKLRTGARSIVASLGKDNFSEIVAFSNYNQTGEVSLFGNEGHNFSSFEPAGVGSNGINVAVGDFFGKGDRYLAVAGGYGAEPVISIYNLKGELIKTVYYHGGDFFGGLNLSATDTNSDGKDELIIGESFGGSGVISIYDTEGLIKIVKVYDTDYKNGLKAVVIDWDGDGQKELIAVPERIGEAVSADYKSMTVSLNKQTLYRWQDGKLLDSFLISSGKPKTPTVVGDFAITRKRPSVRMSGPGYDLPNVPWVASFYGAYTIHGTYWHKNFGHPMSHGCVNMYTPDAKLVYDWSEIGTKISIY